MDKDRWKLIKMDVNGWNMKHKTLSSSKTISRDKILVIRCYLVIKSYNLVIKTKKVKFIKEVKRSDSLWRFTCGTVFHSLFFNDIFSLCRSSSRSSSSSRPISTSLMADAFVSTPRKFSHCLYFLLQRMSRDTSETNDRSEPRKTSWIHVKDGCSTVVLKVWKELHFTPNMEVEFSDVPVVGWKTHL